MKRSTPSDSSGHGRHRSLTQSRRSFGWISFFLTWACLTAFLVPTAFAVPPAVEESFARKYPHVTEVEWEQDSHGYWEAEYTVDGIRYHADFEENGNWYETENGLDFQDLPRSIRQAIIAKYPDEEISELEQVDNSERGKFYDVEFLRNGEKFDVEFRERDFFIETYNEDTGQWEQIMNLRDRQLEFDTLNVSKFSIEFGINVLGIVIFACFIYFPRHRDPQMLFLLLGFNLFLFPILMLSTGFSAGIGFTIFAMLALVRLRSDAMSKTEIAYLLGAVALTFLNALLVARVSAIGSVIVLMTAWFADHPRVRRSPNRKINIRYRSPDTKDLLNREVMLERISKDYDIDVEDIEFESLQRDEIRLVAKYRERPSSGGPGSS